METSFKPVTVLKLNKGVPSVLVVGGRRYTLDTITPIPREVLKEHREYLKKEKGDVN